MALESSCVKWMKRRMANTSSRIGTPCIGVVQYYLIS